MQPESHRCSALSPTEDFSSPEAPDYKPGGLCSVHLIFFLCIWLFFAELALALSPTSTRATCAVGEPPRGVREEQVQWVAHVFTDAVTKT